MLKNLNYALVVTSPLYGRQGSATALNLANAIVQQGHALNTVFFYLEGVSNAIVSALPASDEVDFHQAWLDLKVRANCELLVCSAAAYRRGVVTQQDAQNHGLESWSMSEHFSMSGLAEMSMAMLAADRVVQL
ncbi:MULTISPECIES: sulfurtransferase complex subunit TusD [unclassified Agarivorans]|uniref:sulfurtransferase complex subunit TusD n=1 Tax=unclassified Agarivorans TaxID=2636026 RepID=UPI003D7DA3B6